MKLPSNCILVRVVVVIGFICIASGTVAQTFYPMSTNVDLSNSKATSLEGASLQTVSEQEQFKLRRAKEFAEEGDSRSAIALWQSVLDTAGSQLTTRDEWKFVSTRHEYPKYVTVAHEIESILSELSAEGLDAYRFRADGEARAILANPEGRSRTEVLSEVVRRFFISSVGDEAAFELACLKLDRFEFTGASRLLRKCLEEHPDCTVPKNEILLRLAVANGRIGDAEAAEQALKRLSKTADDDQRVAIVRSDVSNRNSRDSVSTVENDWPLKYGSSDRAATMRGVPISAFPSDLSELWSQDFDVYTTPSIMAPNMLSAYGGASSEMLMMLSMGRGRVAVASTKASANSRSKIDRRLLIDQWKQGGWAPVGGLLFHEGLVYFKRDNRAMCCSAQSGEMVWMGMENEYALDPVTQQTNAMGPGQLVATEKPQKIHEVQLFGDQVHQAMSIGDGNFYSIEGRTSLDEPAPQVQPQQPHFAFGMTVPPRTRRNWLSAYHAINGKLRWRRTARGEEVEDSKFEVGFSCAPVSGGGLTYVTVNDTGAVWLLALNPKDGSTVWKTFLCDEPSGACSAWATTGIAYAEGDVYVGTGAGIVAAVDGVAGALRWAVRYDRAGNARQLPNPYGMQLQIADVSGWREDVVVATGRALVVMGSDSADIFALDRRTGRVIWDSPRSLSKTATAEYYLGMFGDRLYVGGKSTVRCYNSVGGRVVWETPIEGSSGTGIVTEDALYVPQNSSIVKLSLDDGKEVSRSKFITMTREPVGNLYSDGNRLFGVGMARTYVMTSLQERLDELDQRVAKNEADAVLERARFRTFQLDLPATWKDVNLAYALLSKPSTENSAISPVDQACHVVIGFLDELNLPTLDPENTLRQIHQMSADLLASKARDEARDKLMLRIEDSLYRAFTSTCASAKTGLADQILAVAPLCTKDYLIKKARRAMEATCSPRDFETLNESLVSRHVSTRQIAAAGLASLGKQGQERLKDLMDSDPPEALHLQVALALVNAGEADALIDLGQLLNSKDATIQSGALAALTSITKQQFNEDLPNGKSGAVVIRKWQQWISANRNTAPLSLPYVATADARGRTLVCYATGVVEEYDLKGKKTWSTNASGPASASGLSNGHRLVASMTDKKVTEYDVNGKPVWTLDVGGYPTRVYRLENENTLVATHHPGHVFEYRKDGSIAWQYSTASDVADARRMDNGNTLITLQDGKIIRVDASGKTLWSQSGLSRPVCGQPLPNGNMLVALSGQNMVMEVTSDFKTVWTKTGLNGIMDAMRLPDGNTMISDATGVHVYSPEGKSLDAHVPKRTSNNGRSIRIRSGFYSGSIRNSQQAAYRVYRY